MTQIQALTEKLMKVFRMSELEARKEALKLIEWQRGPKK